jgi:predicted alpha/beta superfamily hydrolase
MHRKLLILLFVFITIRLGAQEVNIKKIVLESKILNEEREIWISLPDSYNNSRYPNRKFPVMYLLDPEFHLVSMIGIHNALTGDIYANMPDMIIVGIGNIDRSRDFTPTNSSYEYAGKKYYITSGGAVLFTSFLTKELIPYINGHYRTMDYKILNGHSFGGLYTVNLLLEEPHTFNAYMAHDPSLWWDNGYLYKKSLKTNINHHIRVTIEV